MKHITNSITFHCPTGITMSLWHIITPLAFHCPSCHFITDWNIIVLPTCIIAPFGILSPIDILSPRWRIIVPFGIYFLLAYYRPTSILLPHKHIHKNNQDQAINVHHKFKHVSWSTILISMTSNITIQHNLNYES